MTSSPWALRSEVFFYLGLPSLFTVSHRSFSSGALQFEQYRDIIDYDNLPFVRAPSSKQVVESVTNWTAGA